MKKVLMIFFTLSFITYNPIKCMQLTENDIKDNDLVLLGEAIAALHADNGQLSEQLANVLFTYRSAEFNVCKNAATEYISKKGTLQQIKTTNKRIFFAKNAFFWSATALLGVKHLLPLMAPCIKHFWNTHPRTSLMTNVATACLGAFGALSLVVHHNYSKQLQKTKKVTNDLAALEALERYFEKRDNSPRDESNDDDDREKKD